MKVVLHRFLAQNGTGWLPFFNARCVVLTAMLCATVGGCRTTPVTGRRQLLLVPEHEEVTMGVAAFQDTLESEALSQDPEFNRLVQRVGQRIARVAERPDYDWEFQVIASPEQNAFCLPGGKLAIYEGILPICENEAGLAVVMSHEIAHALARHGGERMSHEYVTRGLSTVLSHALQDRESVQRDRILQAYGVASQYGFVLPYSRKHESEADHMGLMLMARAGYDPTEAPRFWQRFAAVSQGQEVPEFLSTHPADDRRAVDLSELLPEAIKLYGDAITRHGKGETILQMAGGLAGDGAGVAIAGRHGLASARDGCQHCGF